MSAKRDRPPVDNTLFTQAVERFVAALGRRVADADPNHLVCFRDVEAAVEAARAAAVRQLTSEGGYSWAEVGRALGVSRQEAHRRYSVKRAPGTLRPRAAEVEAARRRRATGVPLDVVATITVGPLYPDDGGAS